MLYSNGYDKQLESHGTIKVFVQTRCEVDIMFRNEWVKKISQHGNFFTTQKNVFAHKHKDKNKVNCNHFHNILRLLMFYQMVLSAQVRQWKIITYKHDIYKLPHEVQNDLRLRILGN